MIRILIALAVLLGALPARAAEPKPWSIDGGVSLLVIGPGERTTGGVMPTVGVSRSWQASESASIQAGLSGGVFGFGGGWSRRTTMVVVGTQA